MINICIVSVKRLPGTESPEGEVKLKSAESSFFSGKNIFLVDFAAVLDHNLFAGLPWARAQALNLR